MTRIRHLVPVAVLAAAALLAAGCAGDESDGGAAGGSLTVQGTNGPVTLDGPAERVVATEWVLVEELYAIGLEPVGIADIEGYNAWVGAGPRPSEDVVDVGDRYESNVEKIAALDPDLILVELDGQGKEYLEKLGQIAPVLALFPYSRSADDTTTQLQTMEANVRTLGTATGREDEAEEALETLEEHFDDAAETLRGAGEDGSTFVLSQTWTQDDAAVLRLFNSNAVSAEALERIGLENAWNGPFDQYGFTTVGIEALSKVADTDAFLYVAQTDDDPLADKAATSKAWATLDFVERGDVHPLGGDVWLFAGPLSLQQLVDAAVASYVG